jgi:two-component system, LytTR family, response regulator
MHPPDPNRPLRAVIVDDEPLARDAVRLALEREGDVAIVAECGDGEAAVRAIQTHEPDLVFLDVQMPGLDGFGVIERIGVDRMPGVVFVTAYDEHALRAFEVHALDYVLKPFDDARFGDVLAHARSRLGRERDGEAARALAALLRHGAGAAGPAGYARRIMVEQDERLRFVPVEAIDYLEADGNYVRIRAGPEEHRIRATLTGLQERLDPHQFIRIHRSTVVNVTRVREIQPWFGGDYVAILQGGAKLRVSRRYRDGLLRTTL